MASEACAVCGASVPFGAAAHVILNPPEGDATDAYVCPTCYEAHFEGVFESGRSADSDGDDDPGPESDDSEPAPDRNADSDGIPGDDSEPAPDRNADSDGIPGDDAA